MKKLLVGLSYLLLMLPAPLSGQCRKQMVLYLDVSGSMKPRQAGVSSPYWQVLNAVSELLDEPNFLGPQDELAVVTFGEATDAPVSAVGPQEVRLLLSRLQERAKSDSLSDLGMVLTDLAGQKLDSVRFQRRLAIVASDFVHEPGDLGQIKSGSRSASYLSHFNEVLRRVTAQLSENFGGDDETAKRSKLALFVAPISEVSENRLLYRAVQRDVLFDIRRALPEVIVSYVDQSDQGTSRLAETIRRGLLFDLEVTTTADVVEQAIRVRVDNPNCLPVTPEELRFHCLDDEGKERGDPVHPVRDLPPVIPRTSKETIVVPLSSISCSPGTRDYRVEATTQEGPFGSARSSRRNVLEYNAEIASKEWFLTGSTLRVFVRMRGQTLEPAMNEVRLGARGRQLVSGSFEAPEGLTMDSEKVYMLFFEAVDHRRLEGVETINLQIVGPGHRVSSVTKNKQIDVAERTHEQLERRIFAVLTILSLIVFGLYSLVKGSFGQGAVGVLVAIGLSNGGGILVTELYRRIVAPDTGALVTTAAVLQNLLAGIGMGVVVFLAYRQYLKSSTPTFLEIALEGLTGAEVIGVLRSINRHADSWRRAARWAVIIGVLYPLIAMGFRVWKTEPLSSEQQSAEIIRIESTSR